MGRRLTFRFHVACILFVALSASPMVNLVLAGSVSASILSFSPATGNFSAGQNVISRLTLKNTGDIAWTFWIGYSVIDHNGKSNDAAFTPFTLNPQVSASISELWRVPSNPVTGFYTIVVTVWKNQPQSTQKQKPLDSRTNVNSFQVIQLGTLFVDSKPVKGSISVDGSYWGTGPQFRSLEVGPHTITFGLIKGYKTPSSLIVRVSAGQTTTVIVIYVKRWLYP